MHSAATPLTRYLAAAYALLIALACLYPLSGWRDNGLPLFDYLLAPWPKYFRIEDLILNVGGYVPLGFILVPTLARPGNGSMAIVAATVLAALLSLSVETAQNFLPTRVASNVDLGGNALGALIGAVFGSLWGHVLFNTHGRLQRWRHDRVIPGRTGDVGMILAALWLLAQFLPDSPLFSSGDLRRLLALPTPLPFDPERFVTLEATLVAANCVAIGLFARCMMRHAGGLALTALLLLGVAAKSVAAWSFLSSGTPDAWLTPGTQTGLLAGLPLLGIALLLPRILQHASAGMAMLVATTLANLIPENPYLLTSPGLFERGNFLNFHGLTQIVASLWPFVALAYLSALGLWRGEHLHEH
ncbi:MAG: VanZ family protein [Rhodocyclales bacterium]|nr:VanZ family protein [Rhodocyclales bacterium]